MLTESETSHAAAAIAAAAWSVSPRAVSGIPRGDWITDLQNTAYEIYQAANLYQTMLASSGMTAQTAVVRFRTLRTACRKWRRSYSTARSSGLCDDSWTKTAAVPKELVDRASSGLTALQKSGFTVSYSASEKKLTVTEKADSLVGVEYDHVLRELGSVQVKKEQAALKNEYPFELNFGRMKLTFKFGSISSSNPESPLSAIMRCSFLGSKVVKPRRSGRVYSHPHVSHDGTVCLGNTHSACVNMFRSASIAELVHVVGTVCRNYNPDSPYVGILDFMVPPCGICGSKPFHPNAEIRADLVKKCSLCGVDVCRKTDCSGTCGGTGKTVCRRCRAVCKGCNKQFSIGCPDQLGFDVYGKCKACSAGTGNTAPADSTASTVTTVPI